MGFRSRLVRLLNFAAWRRFKRDIRDPESAQARVWQEIAGEILGSPFWKERSPSAQRLADFPITTYEDYRPAIDRSFDQPNSELNGQPILYWGESSGTSGKKKVYPITRLFFEQLRRTTGPFAYQAAGKFPAFLAKPILYFAATDPQERSPSGVPVGLISNFVYRSLPASIRRNYAFPLEVFRNGVTFGAGAPLYALATDLSAILAITPAVISHLLRSIEENRDVYLRILRGGAPMPDGLPRPKLKPGRLAELEAALGDPVPQMKKLWPGLQFVTTWKASVSGWQLPELNRYGFAEVFCTDGQYSATEGWMTVPLMRTEAGSLFHPGAHVIEFAPAEISDPQAKDLLPPWKLQAAHDYEVFVTTAMGFVRYRLYDVVRCQGFVEKSPLLEFLHKSGNVVSLGRNRFFSEVTLLEAARQTGFSLAGEWTIAPSSKGDQMIFCAREGSPEADSGFAENVTLLDQAIATINPRFGDDYRTGVLKTMAIKVLPPTHPFFSEIKHAQSKRKLITKTPIDP